MLNLKALFLPAATFFGSYGTSYLTSPPQPRAPATLTSIPPRSNCNGLKNEVYQWRGQQIRYISAGPIDAKETVLLIHGLFVNADTWRNTITALGQAGYRTHALDLLGSGYSSKPLPSSLEAKLLNGERGRFYESADDNHDDLDRNQLLQSNSTRTNGISKQSPIRENVVLGTASGGRRVAKQLDLRHPLNSCYNFFTWAEQINDFTHDVIFHGEDKWEDGSQKTTSLIANSKGCLVALQACLDKPEYYNGVCAINPTYRELHESEMRFPRLRKPIVRRFQKFLRNKGFGLYKFVSGRRGIIKKLLKEPYYNHAAIDDELLTAISEPLKLPNSAEIVFDELSYSTGPLFEQQLQDIYDNRSTRGRKSIWVVFGKKDPWIHPKRVESLITTPFKENCGPVVDEVIAIGNAGHCPHDERPEDVVPILLNFLKTCTSAKRTG
ncbi:hypothetical protein ACHAW6_011998 [Cyclotella cf. meneghiniana]